MTASPDGGGQPSVPASGRPVQYHLRSLLLVVLGLCIGLAIAVFKIRQDRVFDQGLDGLRERGFQSMVTSRASNVTTIALQFRGREFGRDDVGPMMRLIHAISQPRDFVSPAPRLELIDFGESEITPEAEEAVRLALPEVEVRVNAERRLEKSRAAMD